jgi:hypothetical protein
MPTQVTAIDKASESIEAAIQGCGIANIADLSHVKQAVRLAQGLRALRAALSDDFVREVLLPLQGTKLGFLTDKDRNEDGSPGPGYPIAVVRDCSTVALIHGFNIVGNEFNIIANGFYGTQAGFDRKVREFPGLSHFVEQRGVPVMHQEKGALVPYVVSWRLHGKPMSIEFVLTKDGDATLDTRIPVTVNRRMGVDAILGKARRKMLFSVYQRLTGWTLGIGEGEVGDAEAFVTTGESVAGSPSGSVVPAGAPEGRRVKIGGAATKPAAARAPAPEASPAASSPAGAVVPPDAPPKASTDEPAAALPPVDVQALHAALGEVDNDWKDPSLLATVEAWNEPQRRAAFDWAMLLIMNTGSMEQQLARPAHTKLSREPGEEG